jgi:hypothetical protein
VSKEHWWVVGNLVVELESDGSLVVSIAESLRLDSEYGKSRTICLAGVDLCLEDLDIVVFAIGLEGLADYNKGSDLVDTEAGCVVGEVSGSKLE